MPASLPALAAFALVHVLVGRMRFLAGTPRSHWLSVAGGVAVAYVFLHLLPELAHWQQALARASPAAGFPERHVYLIALAGLVVFYGLERLAVRSRARGRDRAARATSAGVFALHIGCFAAYNALVGYLLLQRESEDAGSLVLFALAMALHFLVTDHGLREHHQARYDRLGRWLLCAAVAAGYLLGLWVDIHEAAIAVLAAFLAGGVVLNVMKEELPQERESRFSAFLVGAAAYGALLLAL